MVGALTRRTTQGIRLTIPPQAHYLLLEEGESTGEISLNDEQIDYLQEKFMRYCLKCQCIKPPRTHHCSRCGRCVLRMDHHCRWVDNCVGQRNLKIFLIFVLYLSMQCLYTVVVFFD